MATAKKAAEPEKPEEKPEPEKAESKKSRKDIWAEPCPVCGLLGCRRHAD